MAKRTSVQNVRKIETSEDVELFVSDKRAGKRANKQKAKRRNRHYVKLMMRHLTDEQDD